MLRKTRATRVPTSFGYLLMNIEKFKNHLINYEKSESTVSRYVRDVTAYITWLDGREMSKELMIQYKAELVDKYEPASVNTMLASLNAYFDFIGHPEYKVRNLKVQRGTYIEPKRELTKNEYERLLKTAYDMGKHRIYYIMQTICSGGIIVSELRYITVEALKKGVAYISNKGKNRRVYIKYTTGGRFTCVDSAAAKACVKRTYDSAMELFAYLCKLYGLNPLTDICSHKEGCAKGIATNHGDPEHLWIGLGTGYTMDGFRKAVKNKMDGKENIEVDLNMSQYTELKKEISEIKAAVDKINSKMIYNYVDSNMPDWAKPTVKKMMSKGYLKGDDEGKLGLTDELLRVFVINDRAGVYGD